MENKQKNELSEEQLETVSAGAVGLVIPELYDGCREEEGTTPVGAITEA